MEKLIKLLNEYEAERKDRDWRFQRRYKLNSNTIWRTHTNLDSGWDADSDNINREIVSKSYGFIKWLVENNKIDLDKTGYKKADFQEVWNGDWPTIRGYEMLLMLLSISDTPIKSLLLYLK